MIPLLFIAMGMGLLYHAGASEVRHFENHAAQEIRSKLDGKQAKVRLRTRFYGLLGAAFGDLERATIQASNFSTQGLPLFTDPELSTSGRIRDLRLELVDFSLRDLRIERLQASIPECRYDFGLAKRSQTVRLSRSGEGDGRVWIRDVDLEAFILRKFHEIKRVTVRFSNGRAKIVGYGEFLIFKTNFAVDSSLEVSSDATLSLSDVHITFEGQEADETARDALLKTLNPVVDLNKDLGLHGAVSLRGLRLGESVLEAWGVTRIPTRPKEELPR